MQINRHTILGQLVELKTDERPTGPVMLLIVETAETTPQGVVTERHRCIAEGSVVPGLKGIQPGDPLFLEGRPRAHLYEKNGQKLRVTQVHVERFQRFGSTSEPPDTVAPAVSTARARTENPSPEAAVPSILDTGESWADIPY